VTRSRLDERIAAPGLVGSEAGRAEPWLRSVARTALGVTVSQGTPLVKALAACSLRELAAVSLRPGCGPAAIENRGYYYYYYYYSSNVRHWDQTNLTKHNLVLPALHSGTDPSVGGCFVPPLVIGLRVHGASGRPTHVGKARADQALEPSLESISPNRHLYRCGCAHASSHRTLRRWPVLPPHKLAVDATAGT
jgi:hypothetical protein